VSESLLTQFAFLNFGFVFAEMDITQM